LATMTAPQLLELQDLLNELMPPFGHDPSFRLPSLFAIAFDLSDEARARLDERIEIDCTGGRKLPPAPSLAAAAKRYAEAFKDKGSRPKKFVAFDELAAGLVCAYRRATGNSGAGRSARDGPLLDLVQAVLREARKIANSMTGKPLTAPADHALGEHLYSIARRLRGKTAA
jgi:hypothetical protein